MRVQAAGVCQHGMGVCNGEHVERQAVCGCGERCRVTGERVQGAGLRGRASPTRHGRLQRYRVGRKDVCSLVATGSGCWRLVKHELVATGASSGHRSSPTRHGRLQRRGGRRSGVRYGGREHGLRVFACAWAGVDGVREAVTFLLFACGGGCRRHRGCSKLYLRVQGLLKPQAVGQHQH